jgi:hypothetical protein
VDIAGRRRWHRVLLAIFTLGMAVTGAPAGALADDPVARFLGTYVGSATTYDADGTVEDQRDLEMSIEDRPRGAFTISWVAVTLVDGRRDVPGVERDEVSLTLLPTDRPGVYIEETRTSLFERRLLPDPLEGDPIRWAAIDGDRMGLYSMVIYQDGRYELQAYTRTLTDIGLDIDFRRIDDGVVVRRVEGQTVRVD